MESIVNTINNIIAVASASIIPSELLLTSLDYNYATIGGTITFTGINFLNNVANVVVDYIPSPSFTIINNTTLTLIVPDGVANGIRNILIIRNDNTTAVSSITIVDQPLITSLSTTYASVGGTLTITGTNILNTEPIFIYADKVSDIKSFDNSSVTFTIPNGAVVTDYNNITMSYANIVSNFIPISIIPPLTITSLSTSSAYFNGKVTINGRGLLPTSLVYLRSTISVSIYVDVIDASGDYTSLTFIVPESSSFVFGTSYSLTVINPDKTTITTIAPLLLKIIPPLTMNMTPLQLSPGGKVTVTGTNFITPITVEITRIQDGVIYKTTLTVPESISITTNSITNEYITFTIPSNFPNSSYNFSCKFINADTNSLSQPLSIIPTPLPDILTPNIASGYGLVKITTPFNFVATISTKIRILDDLGFLNIAISGSNINFIDSTNISFTLPDSNTIPPGNFQISVTNPDSPETFYFINTRLTVIPPPTITSVSPSNISFGGEFTIYGMGLTQYSKIYIYRKEDGASTYINNVVSSAPDYTSITVTLFKSDNIPQNVLIPFLTSYRINVLNLDGATFTTPDFKLTIIPPMTINITPTAVILGDIVTVTGTNIIQPITIFLIRENNSELFISPQANIITGNPVTTIKNTITNITNDYINFIISSRLTSLVSCRFINGDKNEVSQSLTLVTSRLLDTLTPETACQGGLVTINTPFNFVPTTSTQIAVGGPSNFFSIIYNSVSSISFIVPNKPPGNYGIIVTNPNQTYYNINLLNGLTIIARPTIISLSPSSASVNGRVTITGTSFLTGPNLNISVGGVSCNPTSFTNITATTISFIVPTGVGVGVKTVQFINGDKSTPTNTLSLTVFTAPTITSISPTVIGAGSSNILIIGTNFVANATVSILKGNSSVNCTGLSYNAVPQLIVCSIPEASPANPILTVSAPDTSYSIRITNPDGTSSTNFSFTFYPPMSFTSIYPSTASANGIVTITGTSFDTNAVVLLGSSRMTLLSPLSTTQLSFRIPPNFVIPNPPLTNIRVTNSNGKFINTSITLIGPLTFSSFSSILGPISTANPSVTRYRTVYVNGNNFVTNIVNSVERGTTINCDIPDLISNIGYNSINQMQFNTRDITYKGQFIITVTNPDFSVSFSRVLLYVSDAQTFISVVCINRVITVTLTGFLDGSIVKISSNYNQTITIPSYQCSTNISTFINTLTFNVPTSIEPAPNPPQDQTPRWYILINSNGPDVPDFAYNSSSSVPALALGFYIR